MTNPPTYERFAHDWGSGTSTKVAIGAAYDERLTSRFKSLDWSDTHATWEPDYRFRKREDAGAWAVDADTATLSTVRERTGLSIPPIDRIPINPRPFADGTSAIEIVGRNPADLARECHRCQADGMLSAHEYKRIYKSADGLVAELLLDESSEATHTCTSCERLFSVAEVERASDMAKAMGG